MGALMAQDIQVSGTIKKDANWSGTVILTGDVVIAGNVTLNIAPGTRIFAKPRSDDQKSGAREDRIELIILGTLIAKGKPEEQIVFSVDSPAPIMQDWYGIIFRANTSQSLLEYCLIEYAYNGIECSGSSPLIRFSTIRYNYLNGVLCEIRANPLIASSMLIENGMAGLFCDLASRPLVENSIISRNRQGVVIFESSRPDLGQLVEGPGRSIGENRIFNNSEYDIYNRSAEAISAQNNFWNSNDAVSISSKLKTISSGDSNEGSVIFEPFLPQGPLLAETEEDIAPRPALAAESSAGKSRKQPARLRRPRRKPRPGKITPPPPPPLKQPEPDTLLTEAESRNRSIPPSPFELDVELTDSLVNKSILGDSLNESPIAEELPSESPEKTIETSRLVLPPGEPYIEMMLDRNEREYVERQRPVYPAAYLASGVEGIVLIEVMVEKDGRISRYRVLRSDGDAFSRAAKEALAAYRYKPGTVNGTPVPYKLVERFTFEIE